jgi:methanol--5-hydroxybenzimidazolylcobamide Co-methyltransferase
MEQLIYDCRLMNCARVEGKASTRKLQSWMIESDVRLDPQAFIISPHASVELAKAIVASDSHYHAGIAAARTACELLSAAHAAGEVKIAPNEVHWLDTLRADIDDLPEAEDAFIAQQLAVADRSKFRPEEYGL